MDKEKRKQLFKLAEELYTEGLQKTGMKCPPVYVVAENEHNFIVISPLYPDVIKDHLKNALTEIRVGKEKYKSMTINTAEEKWENKCPKCGSEKVHEDAVDIYYSKNPSKYHCAECGITIVVELVPFIKSIKQETIQHAAIKRSDRITSIGKSHPEIIKDSPYGTCKAGSEMGFVTSKPRFVNREEALKIAIAAGQIDKDMDTIRQGGLLSENLWADSGFKYDPKEGYYKDETISGNTGNKL